MAETRLDIKAYKEKQSFLQQLCKLHICVATMILPLLFSVMLFEQVMAVDLPLTLNNAQSMSNPSQSGKVKSKSVEYLKNDYVVECMLQKKSIATQRPISIYKLSDGEKIIDGVVREANLTLEVYGTWVNEYGCMKGTFIITNTEDNTFSLKPKESSDLIVSVKDVDNYATIYNDSPVTISKKSGSQTDYLFTLDDQHTHTKYEMLLNKYSVLQLYGNLNSLLSVSEMVTIRYSNGDIFNGSFYIENGEIVPQTGNYKYNNGDIFKGDVSSEKYYGIYVDGTTFFKNGGEFEGNWLNLYKLTSSQLDEIAQLATPSEKKAKASEYWSVNYRRYIANGDAAMQNGKLSDADLWYQLAKNMSPNSDAIKERIEKLNKAIEEEKRCNKLIDRFGYDYGRKLANGRLEVGMTKEMCYAIDIDNADYKISRHIERNGDIIEEWVIDFSNLKREIEKEFGSGITPDDAFTEQIMDFTYAFAESFSQMYTMTSGKKLPNNQLVNNRFKYKYIKFKNDVIIELRKSGSY